MIKIQQRRREEERGSRVEAQNNWLVSNCIKELRSSLAYGILTKHAAVVLFQWPKLRQREVPRCDETRRLIESRTLRLAEWLVKVEEGGGVFRQSTWSSVCRGGSERPWPAPWDPCRYSALRCGCPPHCQG